MLQQRTQRHPDGARILQALTLASATADFLRELVDKCEARGWRLDTCHLGLTGTFLQW